MKNKLMLVFLILFLVSCAQSIESPDVEVLVTDLDTVWAIDFLPNGRMIFTERPGRVSIYNFETKEKTVIAEINVYEISESGLLGIAVDPEFNENNFIYLYYTHTTANRVSQFTLENNNLVNETILLDDIPSARFHDGGRLAFGPDDTLYITTGDATNPSSAQDLDSVAGKILRINTDGSIPEDNPFNNYVWSYGHRNPQGIAWKDGVLFEAEHGPTRNDEINIIEKGQNYGWPDQCTQTDDFINPIRCFTEFTLAPGGLTFYKEDLYVTGLRGTQVRKIVLDENNNVLKEDALFTDLGRIREVVTHDEYMYVATSNRDGRGIPRSEDDKIIRVKL